MQTLFPVDNRCEITAENGQLVLKSPYIHELVQAVKSLPYTERRYDGNRKVWFVDPRHGQKLVNWIDLYAGEVVSLPLIQSASNQPVMKLVEVRYIGACKSRDDGSSAAFGLVGKDWSLIFPENILRAWFDAGDPDPTEAQTLYQVLGVKKLASPEEIKTAFRRMAFQWHPDRCKEPNANEIFLKIKESYDVLSDTNKRVRYDAGLALQQAFEKQQKKQTGLKQENLITYSYRSPLRCGLLMVEGIEKIGRVEVSKILAWEDITKNGKTLVVSWPMGAKEPVEIWA